MFLECIPTEEESEINIVAAYTSSCRKNEAEPAEHIIEQLKVIAERNWIPKAMLLYYFLKDTRFESSTFSQPDTKGTQLKLP